MALIVCTLCGKLYDLKTKNCPFCNRDTSETRMIEKTVLNIKNTRKGSRGFKDSKIINEICEATGMDRVVAKKFLENMEHPYGKYYVSHTDIARNKEFAEMLDNMAEKKAEKNTARCSRCKSTSISYTTKKLSLGRAAVGAAVAGAPGAVLGGLSSKKGYAVCLNCGKKWKI